MNKLTRREAIGGILATGAGMRWSTKVSFLSAFVDSS